MSSYPSSEVRFGEWISEGWKMFTLQWKSWVTLALGFFVAVVLPIGAFVVTMYVWMFVTMSSQSRARGAQPQLPLATLMLFYLGLFGLIIVIMPLIAFLMGGAYRAAFKQLRGGRVEFRDLFSARDCYWRLLGATLIHFALVTIGTILCIIPGFIVAGMFVFTQPLIVERNMGIFDAMRASRELTRSNLLMFTLFAFVVQLIASVGSYACYIGLLVTWPLMFTMIAAAYRDCFGVEGAPRPSQPGPSLHPDYGAGPTAVPPPPQQPTVKCPNCATAFPSTAQFCPTCGRSVGT